jgi:Flp pilus assembly protein TadD
MVESSRLEDLRRRVQKDPASIAFAQLAEECRRAGQMREAVAVCRAGLAIHPDYLSARVTLGRTLIALGQLNGAQTELSLVLKSAPENLAAIRGLAEIYRRRGALPEALQQYQAALTLAPNEPELERAVAELSRAVEQAPKRDAVADRAGRILAVLEQWLSAIHVARAQRST